LILVSVSGVSVAIESAVKGRVAAMARKRSVCFVDDDPDELARFERSLGDRFMIGVGQTIEDALADLQRKGGKKPNLFLLDLYFPTGGVSGASQQRELHEKWIHFLKAQAEFRSFLSRIGQSSEGGLELARRLRQRGRVPFSAFTRKGTLDDAIAALEAGAVSVIKKPDLNPPDATLSPKEQYDRASLESAPLKAGEIEAAIRKTSWWSRYGNVTIAAILGFSTSFLASVIIASRVGVAVGCVVGAAAVLAVQAATGVIELR
jgi:CheY-like chemotaxis protein